MRVSEDRYSRDLRSLALGHRLIRHEVRTRWICAMTGLTDERVRNLLHSYGVTALPRHRGAAPTSCAVFFRLALHPEASAMAALARIWKLVPATPVRNARNVLPGLEWGESLCEAFEFFRAVLPHGAITGDQFILLTLALAEGRLAVAHCAQCQAAILIDPLEVQFLRCRMCAQPAPRGSTRTVLNTSDPTEASHPVDGGSGDQQSLF